MKRILALLLLFATLLCLTSCASTGPASSFSIRFIDVGQGDSALVECDGHYMLIDGGDTSAGDIVYRVLEEQGIQRLDILAISHLHKDHFGGLTKALSYASQIDRTISNAQSSDKEAFDKFQHALSINGSRITVPEKGDQFKLGGATVEVIDVCSDEDNDSLVLLITYKKTRFLFTGDIQQNGQTRVAYELEKKHGNFKGISLIKMPHHGAYNDSSGVMSNSLNSLFRAFDPSYCVISVSEGNKYGHPHQETLKIIEDLIVHSKELPWSSHVFRTDRNGDIIVRSNGKQLSVETTR